MLDNHPDATRVLLTERPFGGDIAQGWNKRGQWPAHWIARPVIPTAPFACGYRLRFSLSESRIVRIHVTADERYELYLNQRLIGRGSERGDLQNWSFESFDLSLPAGDHVLAARVWSLGELAPFAQHSLAHGFLLAAEAENELVNTGHAPWEAKILTGYRFTDPVAAWGTGANVAVDGAEIDWDWNTTSSEGWTSATKTELAVANVGTNDNPPSHLLTPATLPAMHSAPWPSAIVRHVSNHAGGPTSNIPILAADHLELEQPGWQNLLGGGWLTLPSQTSKRVLIDLDDYVCGYPHIVLSGGRGASIRINWQEALYEKVGAEDKGNRDEVEGKFFSTIWHWKDGIGDEFVADGGLRRHFSGMWWQAGRYVELLVQTQDEPLTIESLQFEESRYPFFNQSKFSSSDARLESVIPVAYRTLQMCSHETYMDCPFYEQLQYVGDTRLQVLVTYVTSADDRLPRRALKMIDASRLTSGLTFSRYPSRVRQIIPPFSLWWISMVHDFALWRGDMEFVRSLMPGVRAVLDAFRATVNADGLLEAPDGWNFLDWVKNWPAGIPPGGDTGICSTASLQLSLASKQAAELEIWLDEPEMAARHRGLADRTVAATVDAFFDAGRGILADDLGKTSFSEHAQCLSLLAGNERHRSAIEHGLLADPDLERTTIYFTHYLFETYHLMKRTDRIVDRLPLWFDHAGNGLRTTIEHPEPTRSDCHAWGAHPIYHYFASILGIRPQAPGMARVSIDPNLGPLASVSGEIPTPFGRLAVSLEGGSASFSIPAGMTASYCGQVLPAGTSSRKVAG